MEFKRKLNGGCWILPSYAPKIGVMKAVNSHIFIIDRNY